MPKLLKNMSKTSKLLAALTSEPWNCKVIGARSKYTVLQRPNGNYFLVGRSAALRLNKKPVVAGSSSSERTDKYGDMFNVDLIIAQWEYTQREVFERE